MLQPYTPKLVKLCSTNSGGRLKEPAGNSQLHEMLACWDETRPFSLSMARRRLRGCKTTLAW